MTAVVSSLGAMLAPTSAPAPRRGAGDSSDAFGRSLAAASDEATGRGDVSSASGGPDVVGTLPDDAAHSGRPGGPGTSGGQAGSGVLPEGVVPGAGWGVAAGGTGEAGDADEPGDPGEETGVEGAVVLDGQPAAAVLPVVPSPVPPGGVEPSGPVGSSGATADVGAVTGAVGPSSAGPEEQAVVPVPPAGSAARPTDEATALVGQVAAQGASVRGDSTGSPATGGPPTAAQPVGTATAPLGAAGQASGGGAGASSDGTGQPPGTPLTSAPVLPQAPGASPVGTGPGAAPETGGGSDGSAAPTAAPGQVVPVPVPVAQTPVSAAVGQVVPAATAPNPQPAPTFHAQVSGPVFQLLDAGDGDHVLTLSVTPDNLGPVTVRAHIAGGDLRIELFAPHDAGREALRALAAELRRDLAGISPSASLSVSDAKEAPTQGNAHQQGPGGAGEGRAGNGGAGNGAADAGATGRPGDEHPWQSRPGTRPGVPGTTTDPTTQPTVDDTTSGAARRLDVLV